MNENARKTLNDLNFDTSKTLVFDPEAPQHPDDPGTMQEIKVVTPEEEEAAEKERQTLVAKAKWSTRAKITVGLGFVGGIVAMILFALANMSNRDEITASNPASKAAAPAPSTTTPADTKPAKRTKAPVAMVAAVDFTSCKTFNVVTLDNGNKRAIGSDCAPLSVSPAKAVAPATATEPAASAAVTEPAASVPPATGAALTTEQQKAVETVERVTDEVIEELHSEAAPPEGAIEASELDKATTPATPSTK
jgi:hypothetical protein